MVSEKINTRQACDILNISPENLNNNSIRKAYIKAALHSHPDKNRDKTSTQQFVKINTAYEHLKNTVSNKKETQNLSNVSVDTFFNMFLKIIETATGIHVGNEFPYDLLNDIKLQLKDLIINEFKKINNNDALDVYKYVVKFKDILGVDEYTITEIDNLLREKLENVDNIILRPELSQLFEPVLFPITYNNECYFVPLWHEEVEFDVNDKFLIVKIIPNLPDNIIIDCDGSINVNIQADCCQLLEEGYIDVNICNKKLTINCKDITFQKMQTIIIKKEGIVILNHNNVLDGSKRGHVIVHLEIIT
jgi:hypothetical protein